MPRRNLRPAGVIAVVVSLAATTTVSAQSGANPVTITITDSKVKASAVSVPVGVVLFKIVNKAKVPHVLTLQGKKTPTIAAGKSATLRVAIANKGPYVYYSVGPGKPGALRGALSVFEPCTNPASSTITVKMAEAPEVLSQMTVPCGKVTFALTNAGTVVHSFVLFQSNPPRTLARSPQLQPGQTANLVVQFTQKGQVQYLCAETEHAEDYGENGYLTVD
jgi:uncharacterized cupredoxin-like copper-binding protein